MDLILLLPLVMVLLIKTTTSYNCPAVCQTCIGNTLTCDKGGLTTIPYQLSIDTKRLNFHNQQFDQTILTRSNFTHFAKPTYFIESLSIQSSNIRTITPSTFFELSGLDTLDLSNNNHLQLHQKSFENLKLKSLMLDNVHKLILLPHVFDGAMIASLSISRSNLKDLPYDLLKPLVRDLRSLYIDNNKIKLLSSEYEALFNKLDILSLYGNPFLCICPMLWLTHTLKWYHTHQRPRYQPTNNNAAKCDSPRYIANRLIYTLTPEHFNCEPPKLNKIEVKFQTHSTAFIKCSAIIQPPEAPLKISWIKFNKVLVTSSNTAQLVIHRNDYSSIQPYYCLAQSTSGNSTLKLTLTWPPLTFVGGSSSINNQPPTYLSPPSSSSIPHSDNVFFKQQFTLLELIASIISTFIITIIIFIIIYKFYFYRTIKLKKEQMKKTGYATYEVGLYSTDSQTYDIPHYAVTGPGTLITSTPLQPGHNGSTTLLRQPLYPTMKNNFYIENQDRMKL